MSQVAKGNKVVVAAEVAKAVPVIEKQINRISREAPSSDLKPLRDMLEKLDRDLPIATSGEVLSSRVKW